MLFASMPQKVVSPIPALPLPSLLSGHRDLLSALDEAYHNQEALLAEALIELLYGRMDALKA